MPTVMELKPLSQEEGTVRGVHETVRRRIDGCSFPFVFSKITWRVEDGRLTLHGCVPSFYLKQVLQEMMRDIDGVERVANHVDVVSATGLSSLPRTKPR